MNVDSSAVPVLRILRPSLAAYAQRAGPGAVNAGPSALAPASTSPRRSDPPAALAVLRIDSKGRVSWPRRLGLPGDLVSVRSLDSSSIELAVDGRCRGRPIDSRGRVVIPSGVLRATAAGPDDRLVVVALDEDRYALSVLGRTPAVA